MQKIIQHLDAKTITAGGGIILALVMAYFYHDLASRTIDSQGNAIINAVSAHEAASIKRDDKLSEAMTKFTEATALNTATIRDLGLQISLWRNKSNQ